MSSGNLRIIGVDESFLDPSADLAGHTIQDPEGKRWRFVKNDSGGVLQARQTVKFKVRSATVFDVEKANGITNQVCGVVDPARVVDWPDGEFAYVQYDGDTELIHSGETATVVGEFIRSGTGAGKIQGFATAATDAPGQHILARALTATSTVDVVVVASLFGDHLEAAR